MEWMNQNWVEIGKVVMGVFGVVSVIVRLTPTPKDDAVVSKIGKFLMLIFEGTKKIK